MRPEERLIVALDVDDLKQAEVIIRELKGFISIYKIGTRLFTTAGPESVMMVKAAGAKVFLDLKLHDIPNTVKGTAETITRLGVSMFDVHALGGKEMMRAAKEAAQHAAKESGQECPLVLGVTILTHLKDDIIRQELGIDRSIREEVLHLAELGVEAGLDGLICSPRETSAVRKICGERLTIVTPGVRPSWAQDGDQRRTLTPKEAVEAGADYLVVGRPIIEVSNRRHAAERILDEMR